VTLVFLKHEINILLGYRINKVYKLYSGMGLLVELWIYIGYTPDIRMTLSLFRRAPYSAAASSTYSPHRSQALTSYRTWVLLKQVQTLIYKSQCSITLSLYCERLFSSFVVNSSCLPSLTEKRSCYMDFKSVFYTQWTQLHPSLGTTQPTCFASFPLISHSCRARHWSNLIDFVSRHPLLLGLRKKASLPTPT